MNTPNKRAVLLHGTDGHPSYDWQPWLRQQLEQAGYEVFAPELPNNHTPNRLTYEQFMQDSGWDFTDNILIGHSSGATSVLNLLSAGWFPHTKAAVLVGTFLNEKLTKEADWYEPGQFDALFLENYSPELLKQKVDQFYFVHGNDDPFCDIEDAKKLCNELDGTFISIENGGHLGGASGLTELPLLQDVLRNDDLL